MAAMWALVLSACGQTPSCAKAGGAHPYRLGNAAPLLFKSTTTRRLYPHDDLRRHFGNNGQAGCTYNPAAATPNAPPPTPRPGSARDAGNDNMTGMGVPFARHLIQAIAGF